MNGQEPIPDPLLEIQFAPIVCVVCKKPIVGEPCLIPQYRVGDSPFRAGCQDCYAAYVKSKYGGDNHNPDDIRII